ncbi:MAG: hypothetical protein LBK47_10165, partial [Prevotellaceae bacterium]|nr:hypothetical protein [Prevotellaceae bacterium]
MLKKNGDVAKSITFARGYEKVVEGEVLRQLYYLHSADGLAAVYVKQEGQTDKIYYVHTDHLGSIVALTNANGSKLAEYSYDPWGRLRDPQTLQVYSFSNAPSLRLGRGFTGHE